MGGNITIKRTFPSDAVRIWLLALLLLVIIWLIIGSTNQSDTDSQPPILPRSENLMLPNM